MDTFHLILENVVLPLLLACACAVVMWMVYRETDDDKRRSRNAILDRVMCRLEQDEYWQYTTEDNVVAAGFAYMDAIRDVHELKSN